MKKIISIALALVMMMALCAPAFAGTLNSSSNSADVKVSVDTSTAGEGTYTVEIPTTMKINWNTTSTDFSYSVTSNLRTGKAVNVKVEQKNTAMTSADATNTETLTYSLAGDVNSTTSKPVVTAESFNFSVEIAQSEFDKVAIDEYADTVTFTATVV